jgi:multicomponent Na+:H+ antiporter subunit D
VTVHPALVLIGAAAVIGLVPAAARPAAVLAASVGALAATLGLPDDGLVWATAVAGQSLELLRVDPLSRLFAIIFSLITVVGVIFAAHVPRASEIAAVLVYAGGAIGVALAGDWMTTFVFWEVMGAASMAVIWHRTERSGAAGLRYLLMHAVGASLFLGGLVLHVAAGGDVSLAAWFGTWTKGWTLPAALILAGVAVNAAIPPLHAWMTDAYPEASVTGTVFLSAFTTKSAVYVLIRAFPGTDLLLWAGVAMALYGVVYAVLENDIRAPSPTTS